MFHALGRFVVISLLALWSLAAWAVHALAVWTVSSALPLMLGVGLHPLIALWRRRGHSGGTGGTGPSADRSLVAG